MKPFILSVTTLLLVLNTITSFAQSDSQIHDIGGAIFGQDCHSARHNYSGYTYFKVIKKNPDQPEFKLLSYKWVGSNLENYIPHNTSEHFYKTLIIENKLYKNEYNIVWPVNYNYESEFKDYGMRAYKQSIYNFYLNYYLVVFMNKIIFNDNQPQRELISSLKTIINRLETAIDKCPKYNIDESGKFYPYDFSYCYGTNFKNIKKEITGIKSKLYGIPESSIIDNVTIKKSEKEEISNVDQLYSGIYISQYGASLLNMKLKLTNNVGSANLAFEYIFKDGVKKTFSYTLRGKKDRNTDEVYMTTNPMEIAEDYRRLTMYDLTFKLTNTEIIQGDLGDGTIYLKKSEVPLKLPRKAPFWTGQLIESKPHGKGTLFTIVTNAKTNEIHQTASIGTFVEGELTGEGRLYTNDNSTKCWEGIFFNNKLSGPGKIIYPLACPNYDEIVSYYTGNFINGIIEGKAYGINCQGEVSKDCTVSNGNWNCLDLIKDHRTRFLENLAAAGSLLIAETGAIYNLMSSTGSSTPTLSINNETLKKWSVDNLVENDTYLDEIRKFSFSVLNNGSGAKYPMYSSTYIGSGKKTTSQTINTYKWGNSDQRAVFSINYYPESNSCFCHGFRADNIQSTKDAIKICTLKFMELSATQITN